MREVREHNWQLLVIYVLQHQQVFSVSPQQN